MSRRIHVVLGDASAVVRQSLAGILAAEPGILVAGAYGSLDGVSRHVRRSPPHVLLLDHTLPGLEALPHLEQLRQHAPVSLLLLTERPLEGTPPPWLRTLTWKRNGVSGHLLPDLLVRLAPKILRQIRALHGLGGDTIMPGQGDIPRRHTADAILPLALSHTHPPSSQLLVGMGASTGGTEALARVLARLPENAPAVVMVQHMPASFTRTFAQRLNSISAMRVQEAEDGEPLRQGWALLAPGDHHLLVRWDGQHYVARLAGGPPVNRHRPAVDVLFRSLANSCGNRGLAVLLTGMGTDGAAGMGEMKSAGAHTIAQDQRTSLVFGMPKAAIDRRAACRALPLDAIAGHVMQWADSGGRVACGDGQAHPPVAY